DLKSGHTRVATRTELRPIDTPPPESPTDRLPALENVTERQLEQLREREEELRPYLHATELSGVEAQRLARKLGVTGRTVRRWLHRYRRYGDATALLPRLTGVRRGQ